MSQIGGKMKTYALDLLTGFAAFLVVIAAIAASARVGGDLRGFVVAASAIYLAAGFLRGRAPYLVAAGGWAHGLMAAAGGHALTSRTWLAAFVGVSLVFAICGVQSRKLWAGGRKLAAGLVALVPLALVALAAVFLIPELVALKSGERVNPAVAPFSLSTLEGATQSSAGLRGHVTVLASWATWCGPCRAEYASLREIDAGYRGNPRVMFLAVNTRDDNDAARVRAIQAREGWTIPVATDQGRAMESLGLSGTLPAIAILDQAGRLRWIHTGYDGAEGLAASVRRAVDELL